MRLVPCLLLWIALPAARLDAQAGARVRDLGPGRFLVASRGLLDPNFARSVVLLIQYNEDGAMGLVINRPTKLPLSRVLDGLKDAKGRSDPVYMGGPVAITAVLALLRSRDGVEEGQRVLAGVYMISSKASLEKALAARTESSALRAYLGYSGWAAGQLEQEVELGSWWILRADADTVFDPDPATVWPRLIQRTEARIARRRDINTKDESESSSAELR